ncbi:hypothetical protein LCGC14_0790750 [marine sediment metagenome]|uniref:AAA domain-containing protein n=1 Tax=marine sediment metagenome TaxID=412755 RepID=A0A0F9SCK1_9ZZZZ
MRLTDLELYRWKWHNEVYLKYKRVQEAKNQLPLSSYWKEYAAFISVLPRQVGKTTMLGVMAKDIAKESFIQIVVPTEYMVNSFFTTTGLGRNYVCSVETWFSKRSLQLSSEYAHLLVDEFGFIDGFKLRDMLNNDWKSVTMVSTLK